MYEEQLLIAKGFPLEDALTVCHSMRRVGTLDQFMEQVDGLNHHKCSCGGKNKCKDCPNRAC